MAKMTCGEPFPGKPLTRVITLLQRMTDECPWDVCSCNMHHIVWDTDAHFLRTVIAVNCSHRGLQQMPEALPSNTTILYLGHNNISDLTPLVKSNVYKHVSDVYLDHNRISSLDALEGAEWLKTFRVFSVYNNFLTRVGKFLGFSASVNFFKGSDLRIGSCFRNEPTSGWIVLWWQSLDVRL